MTSQYVPQVGDRVRVAGAVASAWVDVLHVGEHLIFGRYPDGHEDTWELHRDWIKVETPTPLPEYWLNIYPNRPGIPRSSRREVDNDVMACDRIAVLHIWTDEGGLDHAAIERVTS